MDYNLEILVVIDKLLASAPFNIKFSARNLLQQAGNFCPPYVVFLGMMRAGLLDKNAIAGPQRFQGPRAQGHFLQIAFKARHKN